MELAALRFAESAFAALAVGLVLLPRLGGEAGRFRPVVALFAALRALLGLLLVFAIARTIIPEPRPIDVGAVIDLIRQTLVGKAWAATEALACIFALLALLRLRNPGEQLDRIALWTGVAVLATTSLTGHAIDDTLPLYTQIGFLLHTAAGLTWFGGLFGLIYWMFAARGKSPEAAGQLAERWSLVAKIAMAIVVFSGTAIAFETVGSFANLFATPYGRLLVAKLCMLTAVLLCALGLVRYMTRMSGDAFDTRWYAKVAALEGGFGVALLFFASWIAVINPAAHETDLYYPLPFRFSWAATWGYKVPSFTPTWWWGVAGLTLLALSAAFWFVPKLRLSRAVATPIAAASGICALLVSLSVEAYPDTYNDPTVDYTAESIYRGQQAFQVNCIACHGASGEGNGALAKDLKNAQGIPVQPADLTAPHVGNHTIGDIFHWMSYGGQSGVMPGFEHVLSVDDRWDIINYLLVLSYTGASRFLGPAGQVQWMIAPDFALADPKDQVTALTQLRGAPVLLSFARCASTDEARQLLLKSLELAKSAAQQAHIEQVTVYQGECPEELASRQAVHPKDVESAYSVINRYANVEYSTDIAQAHFLIDKSGYVRARFRQFSEDGGDVGRLRQLAAAYAKEPFVTISLHSH